MRRAVLPLLLLSLVILPPSWSGSLTAQAPAVSGFDRLFDLSTGVVRDTNGDGLADAVAARVVVSDADAAAAARFLPFGSDSSPYPEDLWAWLDETSERTGAEFVAIPHNSNISKGYMFTDRKSTRLNSSHMSESRMPSSA